MRSYRLISGIAAWFLPLWLYIRRKRGKEDRARVRERYGRSSRPRPKGKLLWLHAASVGEATSVLLLIEKIRAGFPHLNILLTTGTVTSARLMQKRLPKEVIHQYAPVDTPDATKRFIRFWRPQIGFMVESELWPNLIMAADAYGTFMCIINGRMSERSFRLWQKFPKIIRPMIGCFDYVFAQSNEDAARFRALGAQDTLSLGNLKYDAALLPCDEAQLVSIDSAIGERPHWLAASTHPQEERQVAQVHAALAKTYPGLLTMIVPRHPERGAEIAAMLAPFGQVALRSRNDAITDATAFYIADTLGEMGLFYRLNDVVFMGGSLVAHGGQNPLEPARLSCAIVTGPHTYNFDEIYREMEKNELCLRAKDATQLAVQINRLLEQSELLHKMQSRVKPWVENKSGAAQRLLSTLAPALQIGAVS